MPNEQGRYRIVIANQHGENRGDEAAMRAMLAGFTELLGDVEFTLLYQFRDRSLRLNFREKVRALPIILPPQEALGLVLFGAGRRAKVNVRRLLGRTAKEMIDAYENADLVVSAPGGPYFGDIYRNHELAHWFFVWLAKVYNKPAFLYAPSAGPFETPWLNPIRRRLYRVFDVLVSRENISADYIRSLLGEGTVVNVTADSALQQTFAPLPREEYFTGERAHLASKFLVAVSLNDHRYPGAADVQAKKRAYEETMLRVLEHLGRQRDCHLLLLPQLYGSAHRDAPYLEKMGRRLPGSLSWEVVDERLDSDMQRRLFSMADLHVASRYHPAIFGNSGLTPGICIYYEHKALGFMRQLELEKYAFDISDLDATKLCAALDEIIANRAAIIEHLKTRIPEINRTARRTTELAVALLERHAGQRRSA